MSKPRQFAKPNLLEALGLLPLRERFAQTLVAWRGAEDVPPMRWDRTALQQLYPLMSPKLWLGKPHVPRAIIITNLYNHTQTPIHEGWSTRKTQMNDFRGKKLTYDSHNGTDFAIPVGTTVVAPAAGVVVRVVSEFNRGGLKIFIDHGRGLMTNCAHLARPLVREGQRVQRGEPIGVSGYSGVDALFTFPFGVPHVHFNTWLNGEPVDPFSVGGEKSLWLGGSPTPGTQQHGEAVTPSVYDAEKVNDIIASCKTPSVKAELLGVKDPAERAAKTIIAKNYYPTRFERHQNPYVQEHPRAETFQAPFDRAEFDRVVFLDDI